MKKILGIFCLVMMLGVGCKQNDKKETQKSNSIAETQSLQLAQFLEKAGDIINSQPTALVEVDEAFENQKSYLFVDIRKKEDYLAGHIEGSKQVDMKDLLNFVQEKVVTGKYPKVILVCYSGQSSIYAATLLKLLGYGNVYSLKYGIEAWNKSAADHWAKNTSNKLADKLETTNNAKANKSELPVVLSDKKYSIEILEERVEKALVDGFKKVAITIDSLMVNPSNFYIINYWEEEKYNFGHLPGSVQYTPKKSMRLATDLLSLPNNKPIAVYCNSGQASGALVAFLRVLGYDAYSVKFGGNGFMNNMMLKNEKIGNGFEASKLCRNYPIISGEEKETVVAKTSTNTPTGTAPSAPKTGTPTGKKKAGGGGC